MRRAVLALVLALLPTLASAQGRGGRGGDPTTPVFWSGEEIRVLDERAGTRVNPDTNMAAERLIPSAFIVYRTGPSGAESHMTQADLIFVREGEGSILVGGAIVGGEETQPGEIRGESIEGGTNYPVKAGDTLWVPAGAPHQFFVEEGKHWVITIVKVTPAP